MLKRLWAWFWNGPEPSWTNADVKREFTSIRLEWDDVLDKLYAKEDRERKRRLKALKTDDLLDPREQEPEDPREALRHRVAKLRGLR